MHLRRPAPLEWVNSTGRPRPANAARFALTMALAYPEPENGGRGKRSQISSASFVGEPLQHIAHRAGRPLAAPGRLDPLRDQFGGHLTQ